MSPEPTDGSMSRQIYTDEKLRLLFDVMTELISVQELVFNELGEPIDYRVLQANKAYTDITGIPSEVCYGQLASVLYKENPPPYLSFFAKVALSEIPYHFTGYFSALKRYLSISVVCPKKNYFATIATDITEYELAKRALDEKNKELERYLYIASHDLRSPLVNIQGFSARLRKQANAIVERISCLMTHIPEKEEVIGILSEEIPKTLDFITANVTKMDKLISGLLQLSRTGLLPISLARVDMDSLIVMVFNSLEIQIEEVKAKVEVKALPECWGDQALLAQLFTNIIANAIQYRDPERPLTISIAGERKGNNSLYSVRDTGKGIPERYRQRIWDIFYRLDGLDSEESIGIGLSLIKRITDRHNGRVWFESDERNGTVFFVELPNEQSYQR
jgi:signal transduction histidine kinase